MEHMKNSTSRDFRINTGTVQTVLQEQGSSSEDEVQEEQEPQQEEEETQDESNETTAAAGEQEVSGLPSITETPSLSFRGPCNTLLIRLPALYSTDDGSRQEFYLNVGGKKNKNKNW